MLNIIFISYLLFIFGAICLDKKAAKEGKLTTSELAEKYGYPIETYTVQTEDGIYLRLFRIPCGKNKLKDCESVRQPVLLMHGIINSSDIWLTMGPDRGLGFILANENYDVWLGDFRGSRYSNDLTQNKSSREKNFVYWNASFHEMGKYDYPAFINKIISTKRQERGIENNEKEDKIPEIIVFGHSLGTTAFYVLTSIQPDYVAKRVQIMISFAPLAFMKNSGTPVQRFLCRFKCKVLTFFRNKGMDGKFFRSVGRWLASDKIIMQRVYKHLMFWLCGKNRKELDKSKLPLLFGHAPSGFTTKTLVHYKQLIKSGKFRPYDYGSKKLNRKFYNQHDTPPDYKLQNNKVPIILCYGLNDRISRIPDIKSLFNGLNNNGKAETEIAAFKVQDEKFSYMDFIIANNVRTLLYNPIIDAIKRFPLKDNPILEWEIADKPIKKRKWLHKFRKNKRHTR